jgi:hypothetical protein
VTTDRDRHQGHRRTFRPPDDAYEAAQGNLGAHADGAEQWTMNDFLTACLVVFNENPADMLKRLRRSYTPPKRGRPPKPATRKKSAG